VLGEIVFKILAKISLFGIVILFYQFFLFFFTILG
jgi:hypothetical protein